jgi:hypothetical protein
MREIDQNLELCPLPKLDPSLSSLKLIRNIHSTMKTHLWQMSKIIGELKDVFCD